MSIKKTITVFSLVFFVATLAVMFLALSTSKVYAVSRQEECSGIAMPTERQACYDKLNEEAWYACSQDPNPGTCAENYKNQDASSSKNNQPSDDPITNDERERLTNCDGTTNPQHCLENNPIYIWTLRIINLLAAGVGVVVTIMIIVGGIQYASAGANPQMVQAAKKKIINAIIALIAFFFLYAFLQWLVPGGVF